MDIVKFDNPSGPNVAGNPLPSYPNSGNLEKRPKGMMSYCEFHAEEGHEIQECVELKALVQSLMDNKELELFEKVKGPEGMLGNLNVNVVSKEGAREENLSGV
ncbi:hypothetical protein GOBAR_DD08882 [Gossypium barbadense]|nr:hypothetical protein GOBAR_DD08882 [Gossypium barbadense]